MKRGLIFIMVILSLICCSKGVEKESDEFELDSIRVIQTPFELHYGKDEMCVQWTTPFAIQTTLSEENKLIWGWTDKSGGYGVGSFDKETKEMERIEIGRIGGPDMHNNSSVFELTDGRIGVVSCKGHNSYPKLWIYASTNAGDITRFDAGTEVTGFAGTTTYSQIVFCNSLYYVFTRTYSQENGWRWQVICSSDFHNWSMPKNVVLANEWQYYVRFVRIEGESDLLRMVMYSNPTYAEQTHIRLGYVNLSTGNIYSGRVDESRIIGNFYENNAPTFTSFEIVVEKEMGRNQRLFDVACTDMNNLSIAFARWTTAYDSIYYVYQNGSVIQICSGGEAYLHDRAQLGARLMNKDNIAVARNADGMDYLETYKIVNGKSVLIAVIDQVENGSNHFRINQPMLDESSQYLFYAKGTFDTTDYTLFNSDLVFTRLYDLN